MCCDRIQEFSQKQETFRSLKKILYLFWAAWEKYISPIPEAHA